MFKTEPVIGNWVAEKKSQNQKISWREIVETSRSDSQRVGMAAPRPIKGILKNKTSGTNVKSLPDDVQAECPEQAPGLSEDDQQ